MPSTLLTAADGVRVAVSQLLHTLDADQFQVIRLLYGEEPMTTREATSVLGISHTEVHRTRDESLARMRKFLEVPA